MDKTKEPTIEKIAWTAWLIPPAFICGPAGIGVYAAVTATAFAWEKWKEGAPNRQARRAEKARQREAAHQRAVAEKRAAELHAAHLKVLAAEADRVRSLPPPEPPATPEQKVRAARERHEAVLREIEADPHLDGVEKGGARRKAKQNYLRELDGLL